MEPGKRILLSCVLDAFGTHPGAWAALDYKGGQIPSNDVKHYAKLARMCEDAFLDFLFIADVPAIPDGPIERLSHSAANINSLEPLTLLSALTAVTDHIGLVATTSTSYSEPYNVARMYASLDHLSGGRAGWNVVTTRNPAASRNFGSEGLDEHDRRYARAEEYVDVVKKLWDSWDDDAFLFDGKQLRYFDPARMHVTGHKGEFYSVAGPLNIARPPQGHPIITQAGGSDAGKELAARTADVVFINAPSIDAAKEFYADLKGRMAKYGRSPDDLKIMSGIALAIGDTEEAAISKAQALAANVHEDIGRNMIEGVLNVDLSQIGYDSPIPAAMVPATTNKGQTYFNALRKAVEEGRTLRQMASRFAEARVGSIIKGTPQMIADSMEQWFRAGASDGFMLRPLAMPDNLKDICDLVLPELRRRGLVQSGYEGKTLRENLGIGPAGSHHMQAGRAAEVAVAK